MIDCAARTRLDAFFKAISDLSQFMECDKVDEHTRGFQGETPLKVAVVQQNLQVVTDLLSAGANPNLPGEDNQIPLHHAVSGECIEIVKLLIKHGSEITAVDVYGNTPLDYATDKTLPLFKP